MNTRKRYIEAFSLLERDDIDQHSRMAEFLEIVDSVGRAIRDSEYRTIFKMGDLSIEDFYEWGNSSIVHNAAKKVQRRIGKFIKQQHEILRKVRISESNKKRKEQARV